MSTSPGGGSIPTAVPSARNCWTWPPHCSTRRTRPRGPTSGGGSSRLWRSFAWAEVRFCSPKDRTCRSESLPKIDPARRGDAVSVNLTWTKHSTDAWFVPEMEVKRYGRFFRASDARTTRPWTGFGFGLESRWLRRSAIPTDRVSPGRRRDPVEAEAAVAQLLVDYLGAFGPKREYRGINIGAVAEERGLWDVAERGCRPDSSQISPGSIAGSTPGRRLSRWRVSSKTRWVGRKSAEVSTPSPVRRIAHAFDTKATQLSPAFGAGDGRNRARRPGGAIATPPRLLR